MKKYMKKLLGCMVALCLCAALCCGACAEGAVDLVNTPNHDGFLGFCRLPDGGLVLAGFTEIRGEGDMGRIVCLNADRTLRWTYEDKDAFSYATVTVTKDGLIAAYNYNGVKFFTQDGKPAGKDLELRYFGGEVYDITPLGILSAKRVNDKVAEYAKLLDWDGYQLCRINVPESMWVGSAPIAEEDGLVLFGREGGEPGKGAAKIEKVDLQGKQVWAALLQPLFAGREDTGLQCGIKTSDGGYLAVQWETVPGAEEGHLEGRYAVVKFGADGRPRCRNMQNWPTWQLAEYNGDYVACGRDLDPETGETILRYLWMNSDGSTKGASKYRVSREDIPQNVDSDHVVLTVEKLVPMDDGLWQVICFWDTDEPEDEDPAYIQQDNILIRVPEP